MPPSPSGVCGATASVWSSAAVLPCSAARDATTVLESEGTWEDDLAAGLSAAAGAPPVVNLCVYREADLEEMAGSGLDPLAAVVGLLRTHASVVVASRGETLITGTPAIERILAPMRPAGVSTDTWESIARATAVGLAREAARG